jgi:signal transduction histidine kinase
VITIISSDEQTKYIVFDIQLNDQGTAFGWLRLSKIQYSEKALRNTLNSFLVAVPIYVGLAVLGGLLLINKALSPISSIISKAKSISSGNLSVRIGSTNSKDEVGQLAISIDQMMDSIESAYNRQRQFAQDASHELRTPITVITTTAEDAFSSATSLEECKDALQTILVKGKEMSSLISQLLMITKGFSENYEPEVEILDLSLSVQVIVDELSLVASDTGIVIHTCISPGLLIKANQTLLTRLVINLVENAIKYNKHGGNVWVDVYSDKKKNYLVVRDNGIGIGENDIPYIWDRFFKGDRSRADSGTGLGLAMVKWIADLYGATIQVESKIGIGSSFKVGFHSEFQT